MLSSRAKTIFSALFAAVGTIFLILSIATLSRHGDHALQTAAFQRELSRKLPRLESYIARPNAALPPDFVVYQYRNGELLHWRNVFPLRDDSALLFFSGPEYKLQYFSGQPYLVRRIDREDGDVFVIGCLLHPGCNILPVGYFGGNPVLYHGRVLFKTYYQDNVRNTFPELNFVWLAYAFLTIAIFLFLSAGPGVVRAFLSIAGVTGLAAAMFAVTFCVPGTGDSRRMALFLLLNILIFSVFFCLSASQKELSRRFPVLRRSVRSAICIALVAAILCYVVLSVRNLILQTNLELAFINLSEMTFSGVLVVLSYFLALTSISGLVRFAFRRMTIWEQVGMSLVLSACLVSAASWFSFRKEEENLEVATAALALNRDMDLEKLLTGSERQIQNDTILVRAAFGAVDVSLADYVSETYLSDMTFKYDVSAYVASTGEARFLREMRGDLARISPDSRFYQIREAPSSRYLAIFPFYQGPRVRNVVIILDSKARLSSIRQTDLHPKYSYARYHDGVLMTFRGQFAYPTVLSEGLSHNARFRHFVYDFGNNDRIVVSRERVGFARYVSAVILSSLLYLIFLLIAGGGESLRLFRHRAYFERNILRISEILVLMTVLVIFGICVFFIYGNNKGVMDTLVAEKIGILQSAVQDNVGYVSSAAELVGPQSIQALEFVSKCTESIITIYSVNGQMLVTARQPSVRNAPSYRIPETAIREIIDNHKRYFIAKNLRAPVTQYEMYAPLFNINGRVIGIISSPYFGVETWELENDAAMNVISLISFLIILVFLARYVSERLYHKLIGPLNLLSVKMLSARLDNVEHVEYERQDEIRSIIDSYNLMVDRLERSTRQLAEAERNQAWTGMARQVAHEIKNPLTPMKLQIQRVMRLKAKGDPSWQEKMEEASGVMLEHIDVLTHTADDFSSFAKLYSEDPVTIDLDDLLRRELAMYDCCDEVEFDFDSGGPAVISGPKPQLTRVFVNLLTNAVQAVGTLPAGSARKISVRLSLSSDGAWHVIVFQDNGPGVSDENLPRLFTPNFTTKSGGSGFGLAISKSILDKCGAQISYSRSETLGGACFTIRYPASQS